ncbi:hypothetical protein [Modicisalibacter sp. MOD 31.J]|uniref:hypothetical protein n=1 Tax=Modicisalibacter sp. MOD 31.J TaxID=2831897 RepID=UPI001CCACEB4|nr:hypothetical protein [Modicisalibacter sp. MOD 31.J]MBZ9576765.1 hypothetical protein [Modicisalibacter sp. MOD 31.J]
MEERSEILYATDLAKLLGKTQQAISNAIQRDSDMLPPGRFKMGRLWAWRRSTVMTWLDQLEDGAAAPAPRRGPGRPRSTPVSPQALRG